METEISDDDNYSDWFFALVEDKQYAIRKYQVIVMKAMKKSYTEIEK